MKVIYSFYSIRDTMHSFMRSLFIGNIKQQLFHPGVSLTKLINDISLVIGKKTEYNQNKIKVQSIQKPKRDIIFFVFCFFIRVFYHIHSHLTGQQGKGKSHSFSVLQYHPLTNIQTFILLRCLTPIFRSITLLLILPWDWSLVFDYFSVLNECLNIPLMMNFVMCVKTYSCKVKQMQLEQTSARKTVTQIHMKLNKKFWACPGMLDHTQQKLCN